MPLTAGKLGPARIWPVDGTTRITPVPPAAVARGAAGGDAGERKSPAPTVRANGRIQRRHPRFPPGPGPLASPDVAGRRSTACGTLADLHPARDRRHARGK